MKSYQSYSQVSVQYHKDVQWCIRQNVAIYFYSCVKSLITQKCEDMPLIHLLTLKS
jgi:hypothetical protein